ncbi:MAG TPA: DUF4330 domain-containing protein [Acetivibrio sp.]|uniref:DUF4330 domain-containing protein n=1 Tax=Acetivibrio sp. TaxID=1872092 RepID=UPI002C69B5EE|nr:DUF4330 domain-containing protein [Acetivibrio sp.]HOM02318.1 DUF4330 domain-containing protein [Acetivibrio sp.]
MIIDSKGKLFGKVSIIDILVLVVLVAGIFGVWVKFFKTGSVTPIAVKSESYIVGLYWEESPEFAVKAVKVGDIARDFDRGAVLGKVTDVQIADSISFVKTDDGRVVASSTPGYVSYHITLEATGTPSDLGGVIFDGMDYQIGKSMTVKVGSAIFMGRIDRLEKKG